MDDQKKNKLLVGLLAVMALGAGGWFVFIRDTGTGAGKVLDMTSHGRMKREKSANVPTKKVRKTRERSGQSRKRASGGRIKRKRSEKKSAGRAQRGASKRATKKRKKKEAPAA